MLLKLNADAAGIAAALDAIEQKLTRFGLKRKEITRAMLASEELITSMQAYAPEGARMQLSIRRMLGDINIEINIPGAAYDFAQAMQLGVSLDAEEIQ